MFTLIKKELKSLFCTPFSLAIISVLSLLPAVVLAIFLKISQGQSAYAGFENIVSLMALVFAVTIPVVSIITIFRDKKIGADEFIYSMPVSHSFFVLSKLFAQIIFFAIPTALMATFPIILQSFGYVNLLHAYLALVLLEVFEMFIISLSFMISMKSRKMLMAFIVSYAVLLVSFVLGILSSLVRFLPFGSGFDNIFGQFLSSLSVFKKVDTVVYELFDWTALLFFAIGAVVFACIAVINFKKKNVTVVLTSIILLICIGVLPIFLPNRLRQTDINVNKLYTTNTSVEKYLSLVDDEITVYLIDPYTNEQELYNAIVRTVECGKNINFKIVNSAEDKAFLEKYGLEGESQESLSYAMIVESSKRWSFLNGEDYFTYYNSSMGYLSASELQYRYTYCASIVNQYYSYYDSLSADMQDVIQKCVQVLEILQSQTLVCLQFESAFADAVAYVTADKIPTVYFLTGHGEEGTTANPYNFRESGVLPENADVIVINSPSEDYSEGEVQTIVNYIENGGKLYILVDSDNYSMPNITNLLSVYGLSIDNTLISVEEETIVPISVNKSHEAFSAMSASEVTMKDVSKVITAEDSKYTYTPMLSYVYVEGEGEEAESTEYPVAVSVSKGGDTKITLFTGATTFNSADNGLSEEELERVSPTVTNVMTWMFDAFDSGISSTPPKLYQKSLYVADDGQITKIVIAFIAVTLFIAVSMSVYILSRSLRSKRASRSDE